MLVIHKFKLDVVKDTQVYLPPNAQPLTVQMQHGEPHLWAVLDPAIKHVLRIIICKTTGTSFKWTDLDGASYIGTVQDGGYVAHYFIK